MDARPSTPQNPDPQKRNEWDCLSYFLGEVESLTTRGLIAEDASRTILGEYSARRDQVERTSRFNAALKAARDLAVISPREALSWASRCRSLEPERSEGWIVEIELLRRMRRSEEADQLASDALRRFPDLKLSHQFGWRPRPESEPVRSPERPAPSLQAAIDRPPVPTISWSTVAGEFLQEHWQKLISGLAVLLIVVSSTVGAHMVLGPLLWSPVGKGTLALLFTAMFAGFGVGLVRWGAERAGQMMLATTLIVIPINLMLLGELKLLADPTAIHIGMVAVDGVLLFLLARMVVGALGIGSAATFTTLFFGIAVFNVGAIRGMPLEPGFAVFLAPSVLFLGSVTWLTRRLKARVGSVEEPPRIGFIYLEFGLLAFAFLSGMLRTGGAVLQLPPTLYAIPAMLAAIAGIATARAIEPFEKDRQRTLLFLQGGLALSALGFALALARPYVPSALLSGNTLAVAVLGLALYTSLLRSTRKPVYLYCGFAAMFLAYFGAFYFAKDLIRTVEDAARQALGYDRPLPFAFRAINGLIFNIGLAWLSRFFARRWSDERLARHCHYIGLPLSVAACVLSGFEPKAAVICLSGYALLYSIATPMFVEPRLIYLACLAAAGSAFYGSSLRGGATLDLRSMIASVLGLVFWAIRATPGLKRAGEAYQTPLIRSARVMAGFAMAMATLSALGSGVISPNATLAFLLTAVLALLNGHEAPRVPVYLLATAAMLGVWLGSYNLVNGQVPPGLMIVGLVVAGFAWALLSASELARRRAERSEPIKAYLGAVGWAVPLVVLLAWSLEGLGRVQAAIYDFLSWDLGPGGWVGGPQLPLAFLVGGLALLWLTRFRREPVLVYLGLVGLAGSAECLCGLLVTSAWSGHAFGWMAVTAALCSLVAWALGEVGRRRGSAFYFDPCFWMAGVLAVLGSALAFESRSLSVDSYRLGVAAMLAGALSFGLVAASRRWVSAVSFSIASTVGATYLAVLSQGPASPDSAWILALIASLEAIACRGVGWIIRKGLGHRHSEFARPLDFACLLLTIAAVPLGYHSPMTMSLVAVSSLLLIGCFPRTEWIYGTFLALGTAIYQGWITKVSWNGVIPFVILGAYLAWALAVALQRFGPRIRERFHLDDLRLEDPPIRMAVILGILGFVIRSGTMIESGGAWTALPWLPWTLAGLCLLMLRFEPGRGWVHLSVALTGFGFAATLAPLVEPRHWWLSSSMALASLWALAARGASRVEASIRRSLGIEKGQDAQVFAQWAFAVFGLATIWTVGLVFGTIFLADRSGLAIPNFGGWSDVLLALGLAGIYLALEAPKFDRQGRTMGFETIAVLAAWWLGAPESPFMRRLGIDRVAFLPLVTAVSVVGIVGYGVWSNRRRALGVVEPEEEISPWRSVGLVPFTSWFAVGLGITSVYLAVWSTERVGFATLLVLTSALGLVALAWKRVEAAYVGGVIWCLAISVGSVLVVQEFHLSRAFENPAAVAVSLVLAMFCLWTLAGRLRTWAFTKGAEEAGNVRVAVALERVAIWAAFPSTYYALLGGQQANWLGSVDLFALAVFFGMVAWRRGREWPVYLAQILILLTYFRARSIFDPSGLADAVILSTLCYLDLGLAELLGRLRLEHFARPTFRFAMVLPLIPIVQAAWSGRGDGVDLFVLVATAAFYALTSVKLRSKTPAYAAAVLFNAFLWLAWSQLGWKLANRPQFYLIPVGFTSILFAEVNRRDLSKSVINGARNLGLVVIYASLAAPIWQTQSFGAWLALLLLSLVGIFAGIGLRVQSFLWLGLACFVADLAYQLGRLGMEHALARWGVMLTLGVALILFVALNEKKRIVATMREYYDQARNWE